MNSESESSMCSRKYFNFSKYGAAGVGAAFFVFASAATNFAYNSSTHSATSAAGVSAAFRVGASRSLEIVMLQPPLRSVLDVASARLVTALLSVAVVDTTSYPLSDQNSTAKRWHRVSSTW